MTISWRPLIFCGLLAPVVPALAQPTAAACVPGDRQCPAQVRMARGATSVLVEGTLTRARENYFFTFKARAGQMLTIDAVKDPGIKWGVGDQIWFPGEKDADGDATISPGVALMLPRDGAYMVQLFSNHMADNPYGPFVLKIAIAAPAARPRPAVNEDKRFLDRVTSLIKGCLIDPKNLQPGAAVDLSKASFHYRAVPSGSNALRAGVLEVDAPTRRKGASWIAGTSLFHVLEKNEGEFRIVWDGAHGGFRGDPVISRGWDCWYDPPGESEN